MPDIESNMSGDTMLAGGIASDVLMVNVAAGFVLNAHIHQGVSVVGYGPTMKSARANARAWANRNLDENGYGYSEMIP